MIPITSATKNRHTGTRATAPQRDTGLHLKHNTNTTEHSECGEKSLHSRSRAGHFTVRTELHPDHVRIEAEDFGGPWRRRQPDGRPHGLNMVEALTGPDRWGTETTTGGGRIVWAHLDLDAAGE